MKPLVDFRTLIRPASPNSYLVAPPGLCEQAVPDADSPVLAISAREGYARLLDRLKRGGTWRLAVEAPDALQLSFVAVTPLLRFRDDVDVRFIPPGPQAGDGESGARMAIYSRSRIGYSDLGKNRQRVHELLGFLQAA